HESVDGADQDIAKVGIVDEPRGLLGLRDPKVDNVAAPLVHGDGAPRSERPRELGPLEIGVPLGPPFDVGPGSPDSLGPGSRLRGLFRCPHGASSLGRRMLFVRMIYAQIISPGRCSCQTEAAESDRSDIEVTDGLA